MTTRLFLKVAAVCGVALLVGCGGKGDDVVVSSHPLNEPLTMSLLPMRRVPARPSRTKLRLGKRPWGG